MFFARKENVGTILGTQKEFAAAERRGIEFFAAPVPGQLGKAVWHYLWPASLIEEGVRASIMEAQQRQPEPDPVAGEEPTTLSNDEPDYFIWSQAVGKGELIGEPLITPFHSDNDGQVDAWKEKAAQCWAASPSPF